MRESGGRLRNIILILIITLLLTGMITPDKSKISLTPEEREYIDKIGIIKAVSMDGVAPLQYKNKDGEVEGISKNVLEEISHMTGLIFEYKLYDSIAEVFNSSGDIIFGIPPNYAPDDMDLSLSYLKSEAILYINSILDASKLEDKIYAAIKGGTLPEGIKEENAIYYDTREDSLNAVEKGDADYGYGNAYSVSFYTMKNGYKNILTIPKGKESRAYSIGFLKDNEILLSIINKSINAIDESRMQVLILDANSKIDRDITIPMILDAYGIEILMVAFIIIIVLLISVVRNIQIKNKLRLQNKRYELLSQISNEYMYEYYREGDELELSSKCIKLFGTEERFDEVGNILKDTLINKDIDGKTLNIKLPLPNNEIGIFKVVNSTVYDDRGRLYSVIGKLVDISKEIREKEELLVKAQLDGLTGIYNAITTRNLIRENIKNKGKNQIDAFILIDGDKFKDVNDTYGHLVGDEVLKNIAKSLKKHFRQTDIIGRIGGDEFCVYMKEIPSIDFVKSKCRKFNMLIQKPNGCPTISVSIGVSIVEESGGYEELFDQADKALYKVKEMGGGNVIIHSEEPLLSKLC